MVGGRGESQRGDQSLSVTGQPSWGWNGYWGLGIMHLERICNPQRKPRKSLTAPASPATGYEKLV